MGTAKEERLDVSTKLPSLLGIRCFDIALADGQVV